MQTKTIRKNIQNKMNEWLSTIIDEKLRTSVKNSLLVSGGCIASMFLNEEVNDYDIYIEKYDILLELIIALIASVFPDPIHDFHIKA